LGDDRLPRPVPDSSASTEKACPAGTVLAVTDGNARHLVVAVDGYPVAITTAWGGAHWSLRGFAVGDIQKT